MNSRKWNAACVVLCFIDYWLFGLCSRERIVFRGFVKSSRQFWAWQMHVVFILVARIDVTKHNFYLEKVLAQLALASSAAASTCQFYRPNRRCKSLRTLPGWLFLTVPALCKLCGSPERPQLLSRCNLPCGLFLSNCSCQCVAQSISFNNCF